MEKEQALFDATIKLIKEHGLQNITMHQIAKESGIHRSTIYRHYKDINHIVEDLEYKYLIQMNASIAISGNPTLTLETANSFIEYVKKTSTTYLVLTQLNSFRNMLLGRFNDGFDVNHIKSDKDITANYLNVYMLIGSVALIDIWIDNGCKEPTEMIAKLIFDSCDAVAKHYQIDRK